MSDSSGSNRLQVMRAVEDGWKAFSRSPWPFVLFTLLAGVLSMLFQAIANAASGPAPPSPRSFRLWAARW